MVAILSLIISIIALIVSTIVGVFSWTKNRTILGIEKLVIREPRGVIEDIENHKVLQNINKKLSSGQYTVLSTYQRIDGDTELLLGKIKK